MIKIHKFDFYRYFKFLRQALRTMVGPKWLTLILIFSILYGPFLLQYGWGFRSIANVDLPSFYAASVNVFVNGGSPYNTERLQLLMGSNIHVFPYLYPPPSLLIFFPLSVLTYAEAHHVVLLVNHLIFLLLVWAIPLHLLCPRARDRFVVITLCIVYSLTFFPVVRTLNLGQSNILFLAFLILFWLLARRGNSVLAAFFLALSISLKVYPLILIPLLLLIGRWRECAYTIAWLILVNIVSFLVLPKMVWGDWLVNVMPTGGYISIPYGLSSPAVIWNQGLNGFFARAFTESEWSHPIWVNPHLAKLLTYSAAGLTATVTGIVVWRSRIFIDNLDRTILVALPAMYLIAPYSWDHHVMYLLPSILMLLNSRYFVGFAPKVLLYSFLLASSVLISTPWLYVYDFYGVVVLWALCVFTACNKNIELPNKRMNSGEK
jgi:hypothetical protein